MTLGEMPQSGPTIRMPFTGPLRGDLMPMDRALMTMDKVSIRCSVRPEVRAQVVTSKHPAVYTFAERHGLRRQDLDVDNEALWSCVVHPAAGVSWHTSVGDGEGFAVSWALSALRPVPETDDNVEAKPVARFSDDNGAFRRRRQRSRR